MKWLDLTSHGMALRVLTLLGEDRVLVLENGDRNKSAARELGFRYLQQSGLWIRKNLRFTRAEFSRVFPNVGVVDMAEAEIVRRARPLKELTPDNLQVGPRETYEESLWKAMNERWNAGQSISFANSRRQWILDARHRDAFRLRHGHLEMRGRRQGGERQWVQMGPTGSLIDTLASDLGMSSNDTHGVLEGAPVGTSAETTPKDKEKTNKSKNATIQTNQDNGDAGGIQTSLYGSDATASTGPIQRIGPERGDRSARSSEIRRSTPDAERASQSTHRPGSAEPSDSSRSGGAGSGDVDRISTTGSEIAQQPLASAPAVPADEHASLLDQASETVSPPLTIDQDQKPVRRENFSISPGDLDESRSWRQKALDNISAIELVGRLDREARLATPKEQAVLVRYVGWGGLRNAFPDSDGAFGQGFESIGQKLQELLSEQEYATARRSIQYAHYTSETVVRALWSGVERLGFSGGDVFEPGMGIGHFAGMMPAMLAAQTQYQGLELDHMTARIARHLYPNWTVQQADYTQTPTQQGHYDLVIGNPPFADVPVQSDKAYAAHRFLLHDFFFAKSLDQTRPGGLLAFVTSAGTMNKADTAARSYMADRADLLGAIRLPETAFQNAGTKVTTDILFFRKREDGVPAADRSWTETVEVTLADRQGTPTAGRVSRWFAEHPEMVLGEEGFFSGLWKGRYGVKPRPGSDLNADLATAIEQLPQKVMTPRLPSHQTAPLDFASTERKEGAFYLAEDGALMQMRSGAGHRVEQRGKGIIGGKSAGEIARIKALIPIRDSLRAVYKADMAEQTVSGEKARQALNQSYDAFVEQFGPINKAQFQHRRPSAIQQEVARAEAREEVRYAGEPFDEGTFDPTSLIMREASWSEIARARRAERERCTEVGEPFDEGTFNPATMSDVIIDKRPNIDPFMDDPESYRLRSIERYDDSRDFGHKTEVFFQNILTRDAKPTINSVEDAVLYVLNIHGTFSLALVAEAAHLSEQETIERLGERIFQLPGSNNEWVTRDDYLSGNVRQKLRDARTAAERNPGLRRNVEALEEVQPFPLGPAQINANLGMPWLPADIIEDFGCEALGLGSLSISYQPQLATWTVVGDNASAAARSQWGTSDRAAPDLINDALNRQNPKIYRAAKNDDGTTERWLDVEATEAAQSKMEDIKQRFRDWVWSKEDQAARLSEIYNDQFNNLVVRDYDGSYLTTPGVSATWSWRPHQKRVIARIIQSGNTYVDHTVGAGKTSEMIGAGMEMRRLGLVRKPLYVVPNHMLGQFTSEFYQQYPTAKIMVADERRFHTDRRRQFIADVATEDLDAVIITHSAFGLIPVSATFQDQLIQDELDSYRFLLGEIQGSSDDGSRFTRRRVEQQIERLEQRLSGKSNRRTDQVFTFEEMGVDFLFVDEAHMFRKLDFSTKMSSVKGISPQGSGMAWDLWVKTRYLEQIAPGRNLVLASGTPITNTMAELYTVSRYLQNDELKARGLAHFDAWAGTFGDTVTQLEQDPSGGYQPVTRFAKFVNVPELSIMVRQVMDVVTSRQLDQYVTRPQVKGGQRQMNLAPKTPLLEEYQDGLARRMEAIAARKGPPKPGDDIILSVINDGRHAAIDMRLVEPTALNDPNSKLNLLVENVYRIWAETKQQPFYRPEQGGYSKDPIDVGPATQMIFSNLGVSEKRGFSVHKYIVSELVSRGVPKDEIAQIATFKTHVAKARLFNDMNEGKVRILIGSTAKMGTGVNAQRRLRAIHNLDPLWFPSDDEQRNGRGIRQGNLNREIEIHDYSTKGTYDSTMWGLMETKARFIQAFFEGDPTMRDMDDLGEVSVYEQAKALSTADERLIVLTDLRQKLERCKRGKIAFERNQSAIGARIQRATEHKRYAEKRLRGVRQDIEKRQDTTGDAFKGLVQGQELTERVAFGQALMQALDAAIKNRIPDEIQLGEIGGFPIMAHIWQGQDADGRPVPRFEVYLLRSNIYESAVKWSSSAIGLTQRIERVLARFEAESDELKHKITLSERTIGDYSTQTGQRFTGQGQIDDLQAEVDALEAELEGDRSERIAAPPVADEHLTQMIKYQDNNSLESFLEEEDLFAASL
jgi:N12 class adenine-specific DNA methylase